MSIILGCAAAALAFLAWYQSGEISRLEDLLLEQAMRRHPAGKGRGAE